MTTPNLTPGGRLTILMVDDDANLLAAMRRTLGRKYRLLTAESGAEGLGLLDTEGPVPICFTDMQMPVMDGLEFIRRARARYPETVYVMLTGNADSRTEHDAIEKGGVFRFLNKPCSGDALERVVGEFCEAYRAGGGTDAA